MSGKHTMTLDYQITQARKLKQLEAENARLRAALAKFGKHFESCALQFGNTVTGCTCGLDESLNPIKPKNRGANGKRPSGWTKA